MRQNRKSVVGSCDLLIVKAAEGIGMPGRFDNVHFVVLFLVSVVPTLQGFDGAVDTTLQGNIHLLTLDLVYGIRFNLQLSEFRNRERSGWWIAANCLTGTFSDVYSPCVLACSQPLNCILGSLFSLFLFHLLCIMSFICPSQV